MSGAHDAAQDALKALLWELPAEFSQGPPDTKGDGRASFSVIKTNNVRRVHQALWELQEYLDVNQ
jgi:hypothetical protein